MFSSSLNLTQVALKRKEGKEGGGRRRGELREGKERRKSANEEKETETSLKYGEIDRTWSRTICVWQSCWVIWINLVTKYLENEANIGDRLIIELDSLMDTHTVSSKHYPKI